MNHIDLNLNFSIMTINIRGLRSDKKRKVFYNWLHNNGGKNSIIFVQEAHCTLSIMSKWSKEWKGQCFYSHGDSNKCGVM